MTGEVRQMTGMLDLRGGLRRALEESGEPGAAALYDFLRELLDGDGLLDRLVALLADTPRRAQVIEQAAGPDTLLHGDLWTINVFVIATAEGLRARLVDRDRTGVGPFSYDLSTFLFRFPQAERRGILERYRDAVARAGGHVASPSELGVLFDTAERARYAIG